MEHGALIWFVGSHCSKGRNGCQEVFEESFLIELVVRMAHTTVVSAGRARFQGDHQEQRDNE
jgi:hypothetical protein